MINARIPGTGDTGVPRQPFRGTRRLFNAVDVRLLPSGHRATFDCGDLSVRKGDSLVVDTPRGPRLATASGLSYRHVDDAKQINRLIRVATDSDKQQLEIGVQRAKEAARPCLDAIRRSRLKMKLVQIDFVLDLSRAIIYFTSETRVDFRELVRELARILRARVEMRQIGVREAAGVVGGIGPCGKELCCSTFLSDFASVSIRHIKTQGLSLNPQKTMGMCGRLKCCLVYENQTYKEMRRFVPKRGKSVMTPDGAALVYDADVLSRSVQVRFRGRPSATFHVRDLVLLSHDLTDEELDNDVSNADIIANRRSRRGGPSDAAKAAAELTADVYLWGEASAVELTPPARPAQDPGAEKKKRRRRKKKTDGDGNGGGSSRSGSGRSRRGGSGAPNNAQQGNATDRSGSSGNSGGAPAAAAGEGAPKKRRRRRRKKSGGGGQSGGGGSSNSGSGGGGSSSGGSSSGGSSSGGGDS